MKIANELDDHGLYDEANDVDKLIKMVSELSPASILKAIEYASGGVEGYAEEVIEFMHRQQLTDKGGFNWNEFPGVSNWKPIGKKETVNKSEYDSEFDLRPSDVSEFGGDWTESDEP